MSHTWIHNPDTGGYWQCPNGIVADLLEGGWERCDPPAEYNPATAEHAEWREARAAEAAAAQKTEPTIKAAAGHESEED